MRTYAWSSGRLDPSPSLPSSQPSLETLGRRHQFPRDRRLEGGVAGVRQQDVLGARPRLVQPRGGAGRAVEVIPSLDDRAGNRPDALDVPEELSRFEETVV